MSGMQEPLKKKYVTPLMQHGQKKMAGEPSKLPVNTSAPSPADRIVQARRKKGALSGATTLGGV